MSTLHTFLYNRATDPSKGEGFTMRFDRPVDGIETATAPARLAVSSGGRVRVKEALALAALVGILAMLLVACRIEEEPTAPADAGQPTATPTVEVMMEEATATPVPVPMSTPRPTPAPPLNVYESGQTIPDFPSGLPNVVRGGASLQIVGGNVVIAMGNGGTVEYNHATYTCVSEEGCGIEHGRVTAGTIRVTDPSNVESPTPIPTAAATPEPTPTPTATPVRPGRFSEFNGAGAATWRRMHEGGQIVACYEGLALPRDSFCLSEGFRFTPDFAGILDAKFLVAHLPDGDALVQQGNTTSRAGGDIRLGWITFENRVITHLEFDASQTTTPSATPTPRPTATPTQAQSDPDRAVLVALYHSTGGGNWDTNTNWLSDRPIGEWHGVTTDTNGRVTRLNLYDNGLTGDIPSELGRLSNLTWLVLYDNQLTGEIPPELGSLSNLTRLHLSRNQLTGEIPPEFGRLSDLEALFLDVNELTGEIPPELGSLSNLGRLHLPYNKLTGEIPQELGQLSNLWELWLSYNQLTGEIPPELGGLSNLRALALSYNRLTGEIPPEFGHLSNLTDLRLGGLANLRGLLSYNQLTGEIPPELGLLSNLTQLILSHNQLTGEIPPELGGLSSLTGLDLGYNQLTGEIPPELGRLPSLTRLELGYNQLTGEIPPELGRLPNLTWLLLSGNQLTGCIPEGLRDIEHNDLGQLNLPDCGAATPGPTPTPTPAPERDDGECHVSLIVSPGESCTYPGTDLEFSVDSSGTGRFLFFTAGTGIDARNTTINGVTYNFKASKQSDGTWIIEAAGDS